MNNPKSKVVAFSRGIARKTEMYALLNVDEFIVKPSRSIKADFVVGWGNKSNTKQARAYSKRNQLPYYSIEDGFLHSMGQGVLGVSSCSLVKDETGIYYDATKPSALETMLSGQTALNFDSEELKRAKKAIQRITHANISKYNNGVLVFDKSQLSDKQKVLVIDQTEGDLSLEYGHVSKSTFDEMLQAALNEYPQAQIIVKTHPDVIAGKKQGNINLTGLDPRVLVLSDLINPIALLKKVDVVYVATSQMGYEALMLDKKVVCFGVPFYAGWGLTDDRADKTLSVWQRRDKKRTVDELFAAAYIKYSVYIDPLTGLSGEIEDVLNYFELQMKHSWLGDKVYCINFSLWKQNYIKHFLSGAKDIAFVTNSKQVLKKGFNKSSHLITWSSKDDSEVTKLTSDFDVKPWYMEDGFIRSAGLGSDLTAPASLVLDKSGIYYDPNKASDLEQILQAREFSSVDLDRAEKLKNLLLESKLSKYNLGKSFSREFLDVEPSRIIILIPGQVEDDASIKKGCVDINTNQDLIKEVREKNLDAFLIYKPHPDVVSGNRKGKVEQSVINEYTNIELLDSSISDCLEVSDEVHTMTSYVGFEGLMHGLKVVCYGLPFYSNWGLTTDIHALPRRTRKLQLSELVAATLIEYPMYMNWVTKEFTTPEIIVQQLKEQIEKQGGKQSNQVSPLIRFARKVVNYLKGVFLVK